MAETVYILGAGFNRSAIEMTTTPNIKGPDPPLARDFFKLVLNDERYTDRIERWQERIDPSLQLAELFAVIERYWRISRDQLGQVDFDIEEFLTFVDSMLENPSNPADDEVGQARSGFLKLLFLYLSDFTTFSQGRYPVAEAFASSVMHQQADVLTFNYDTFAERAIESASGPRLESMEALSRHARREIEFPTVANDDIPIDDLDMSFWNWRLPIALGVRFDELELPVSGPAIVVKGTRFYSNTNNALREDTRVLKLHGSIDWLQATGRPSDSKTLPQGPKPEGLVLVRHPQYFALHSPERNGWELEPVLIPPQLYKRFDEAPFDQLWQSALASLKECRVLIVVGYSLPPTDFRTRRLLLEAFSDRDLDTLIVVDPDREGRVVEAFQALTHPRSDPIHRAALRGLYGLG